MNPSTMTPASVYHPQEKEYISKLPAEMLHRIFEILAPSSTISLVLDDSTTPGSEDDRKGLEAIPFVNKFYQKTISERWPKLITLVTTRWTFPQLRRVSRAFFQGTEPEILNDSFGLSDTFKLSKALETIQHIELPPEGVAECESECDLFEMLPQLRTVRSTVTKYVYDYDDKTSMFTSWVSTSKSGGSLTGMGSTKRAFGNPAELATYLIKGWDNQAFNFALGMYERSKTLELRNGRIIRLNKVYGVIEFVSFPCSSCRAISWLRELMAGFQDAVITLHSGEDSERKRAQEMKMELYPQRAN
jgi:hypothetical protein